MGKLRRALAQHPVMWIVIQTPLIFLVVAVATRADLIMMSLLGLALGLFAGGIAHLARKR